MHTLFCVCKSLIFDVKVFGCFAFHRKCKLVVFKLRQLQRVYCAWNKSRKLACFTNLLSLCRHCTYNWSDNKIRLFSDSIDMRSQNCDECTCRWLAGIFTESASEQFVELQTVLQWITRFIILDNNFKSVFVVLPWLPPTPPPPPATTQPVW